MPKLDINPIAGPVGQPRANAQQFGSQVGGQLQFAGRQVSALARIPAAAAEMSSRRKATEYALRLQDEANALVLDNDLANRGENFDKIEKALTSEFRKGVSSPGIFDAAVRANAGQIRNGVMQKTRVGMVEEGIHDMNETLDLIADRSAQIDDGDQVSILEMQALGTVQRAEEMGLIGGKQGDIARERFQKARAAGAMRRLQNDDPLTGLRFLESGQFNGTEAERQVWRRHMQSALRTQRSARLATERQNAAAEARYEKELAETAEKDLIEMSLGDGFTVDDVLRYEEALSPERFRSLLTQAHQGGKFQATSSSTVAFDELRTEALSGSEDFAKSARTAFFTGQLSQTDYTSLLKIHEDASVGQFVEMIGDTVAGGVLSTPGQKRKAGEAERSFMDWLQAREADGNPPTLTERRDFAEQIIETTELIDTGGKRVFERLPLGYVFEEGSTTRLNIRESEASLFKMLDEGWPKTFIADEIERLREFEAHQNRKAATP